MRCLELVEGCPDCDREGEYKQSQGHQCSELCEIWGVGRRQDANFHGLSHSPVRCENCYVVLDDRAGYMAAQQRRCEARRCTEWYCPSCGVTQSSAGPVDCPSCGSWPARGRVSLMHRRYHARRRYW